MSFNRKAIVEFETPQGPKRIEGVDVKFDINLPMSAQMTMAKISICNLSRSDIEYLTTYTSRWIAIAQRKRIRLFAGYDEDHPDGRMPGLFDGDIIQAIPSQPPEIWLECEAMSGAYGSTQMFSKSILVPSTVETIFGQAASWVDLESEWRATTQKVVKSFEFSGSNQQLIGAVANLGDIEVFQEGETLVAVDSNKAPVRDGVIREISERSGMVGVPKVDYIGIEATMFLDSRIKRGDTVNFVSKRIPAANGLYYVYNIRHHGHLRGTEFYTTVKARRKDTYGSELTQL